MTPHPPFSHPIIIYSTIAIFLICFLLSAGCIANTPKGYSDTKITVRELANPIADVGSFDTIVSSVINDNPFGCTAYMTDGQLHAPVEKVKEIYTARLVYEDANANIIGTSENEFNTVSGFNSGVAVIMANATLANAQGGTAIHNPDGDTYYAALRCHDANGEIYYVTFRRDEVVLGAYSDDAIRAKFEAWVDGVPVLAQAGRETSRSPTPLKMNFTMPRISRGG